MSSQKMLFCGFLAITPLWKGLEIKVGGVLKNSGNSLSDRHQNFSFDLLEAEKIGSKDENPAYKILKKMEKILLDETDYFANFGSNFLIFLKTPSPNYLKFLFRN